MKRTILISLFVLLFLVFFNEAFTGTMKLKWDPVSDSDLSGYKIHYGYESGIYSQVVDVGNVTSYTLTGLEDCTTHYLAVTSYDYNFNESSYSNEVFGWPRPIIQSMDPPSAKQAEGATVTFNGSNYDDGSYPDFGTSDIIVESYLINNCGELVAEILLKGGNGERPAEIGFYTVSIVNSDGIQGTSPENFEIKVNEFLLDSDNNGRIDGLDLSFLALHFGTQEGDLYYDPTADLNGDGWIDGDDIAILSSWFGEYLY